MMDLGFYADRERVYQESMSPLLGQMDAGGLTLGKADIVALMEVVYMDRFLELSASDVGRVSLVAR